MLTRLTRVIILQYVKITNHYVVHLKEYNVSIIPPKIKPFMTSIFKWLHEISLKRNGRETE